ncbi:CvfD/Ygs/GSP13 family RNA-binding post-transcriptional regulator [Lactococcus formosensis subsp. formosensis]|uniref:CvfD/Ygs/GSP13 family RNA-binding post-transcriptional regulator n=1 Tax=Lactococcus formosensis TaxID=1281486 RepID=UPI003853A6B9
MIDKSVKIGDKVTAEIIGLQDYGAFVKFADRQNTEHKGLIHISEVQSGFVKNIREVIKVGQHVKAQIIDIDEYNGKVSLSIRSLEENPQNHYFYHKKRFTDSRNKIGFKSLAEKRELWIEEGEKYLKERAN